MKNLKAFVGVLLVTGLLIGGASQIARSYTQAAMNVQTFAIEGFETKEGWTAKFSKFRCKTWANQPKEGDAADEANSWLTWIEATPEDQSILPDGLAKEVKGTTEKTVMGVKGCFDVKGYNWIVLEPKEPVYSRGISRAIDLWVWGSGYNYDLYIVVKNWQGYYYSLFMGNLKYFGWKNLRVEIPAGISQYTNYIPRIRPLEIVRLKLISSPDEKPDDFYAYFDYMQVQTDVYEERYSGDGLNNKKW